MYCEGSFKAQANAFNLLLIHKLFYRNNVFLYPVFFCGDFCKL